MGRYVPLSKPGGRALGPVGDRRGRGAVAAPQRAPLGEPGRFQLEAAVQSGPCRPPADRNDGLGGDRRPLRCAVLALDRFLRSLPSIRARRRSRMRRSAAAGLKLLDEVEAKVAGSPDSKTLLGRAKSRSLRETGRSRRSAQRLRPGDWPAKRPGRARAFSSSAAGWRWHDPTRPRRSHCHPPQTQVGTEQKPFRAISEELIGAVERLIHQ